jgi:uncharacterized protein YqhQ
VARPAHYGGQAVIEGIMIRGQRWAAVACRRPDGGVVIRREPLTAAGRPSPVPFVRGVLALAETMQVGVRCLFFSNQIAEGRPHGEPMSRRAVATAIGVSLLCAALIFFLLPLMLTTWLEPRVGHPATAVFEGLVRLLVLLGYLAAVSRLPSVRRLFEHHGAEHMAVNAYEAGVPLTPERVREFSVIHDRCGTSFMLIVMLVSIPVFALVGAAPLHVQALSRVLLIPAIAAVAYELFKLMSAYLHHPLVRLLIQPNLELQQYTTRAPSDDQIELALIALREVLTLDGALDDDADGQWAPAAVLVRAE